MLPPFETERNRGQHMLPLFETERNGGSMILHAAPVRNGGRPGAVCGIHAAPVIGARKCARNGVVCGYHTAPSSTLGGIKLKRDGVWFSHRLVGFRNEKKWEGGGTSCLPLPPPFPLPLCSPSLAPFPSSSHFLAPQLLDSAPTSLEEGRGRRFDAGWSFVDGDVVAGGCRRQWDGGNGCCWV